MKRFRAMVLILAVITIFLNLLSMNAFPGELLHKDNLKYIGAFRLPHGKIACDSGDHCFFAYGGRPIAVDASGNKGKGSLFIGSHIYSQKIAEVTIPNLVNSNNLNDLNTAQILQSFFDITEGNRNNVMKDGARYDQTVVPGGLLVYGDKLIGSVQTYYDPGNQYLSHYVSSKNLSKVGDFAGMYKIGSAVGARFLAGYMDTIPLQWQEKLGGTAITGGGTIPITSATSVGPSAFAFNPSDLGRINPVPANTLMYYSLKNPLAAPTSTNPMFNLAAELRGVVFPDGSDSVLFFGRMGVGEYCYGIGTSDLTLVGKSTPGSTTHYCYDPAGSSKGHHAYPYKYQVWAYNAHDFIKVRKGGMNPWDVRPYEIWNFELPFQPKNAEIVGTSYDKKNRRLYISQACGDGDNPIVHVFEIVPE